MTRTLKQTALIVLATGLLAACATGPAPAPFEPREPLKPNYPIRTPDAPTADGEAPQPQAKPTEPVAAAALPPPPGASAAPPRAAPAPAYQPPAPRVETVTRTSVTGQVVDAAGPPSTHKVEKGDTAYSIARKFGVSPEQLARDNNLGKSFTIRPGQVLRGPSSSRAKAYQVVSGDTLYAVGRRFSVTPQALAEANNISLDSSLRIGQKLVLPSGYKDGGPITTTVRTAVEPAPAPRYSPPPPVPNYRPAPPSQTSSPPVSPSPSAPPIRTAEPPRAPATPAPAPRMTPPPAAPPASPSPAPPPPPAQPAQPAQPAAPVIIPSTPNASDAQISQLGRGRFTWPLRGAIVSEFGPKGTGQRNDGINIRAQAGATVLSAAAGDVVYAGDQVPGFGNLVLIKHADGWVSAYGHLARVDVKMQDKVAQSQPIGQAGASGGVAEPQLHFEIRYAPTPADRARPINPLLVLPK